MPAPVVVLALISQRRTVSCLAAVAGPSQMARPIDDFLTRLCYQASVSLVHEILGLRARPDPSARRRIPKVAWTERHCCNKRLRNDFHVPQVLVSPLSEPRRGTYVSGRCSFPKPYRSRPRCRRRQGPGARRASWTRTVMGKGPGMRPSSWAIDDAKPGAVRHHHGWGRWSGDRFCGDRRRPALTDDGRS